jgi:hypothetical protein
MWAVLTSLLIIERLLQIFMAVKTLSKYFLAAKRKSHYPFLTDSGFVQMSFAEKPLSAKADNDDNANADKNILNGGRTAGKCRIKFVVFVTHWLWLQPIQRVRHINFPVNRNFTGALFSTSLCKSKFPSVSLSRDSIVIYAYHEAEMP